MNVSLDDDPLAARRRLRRFNGHRRPFPRLRTMSDEELTGKTLREIAEAVGCSYQAVALERRARGLETVRHRRARGVTRFPG
jgi:hypothetical protein